MVLTIAHCFESDYLLAGQTHSLYTVEPSIETPMVKDVHQAERPLVGAPWPLKPQCGDSGLPPSRTWLPLAAVSVALANVVVCYVLSRAYLPPAVHFPFISMMGMQPPARWVYCGGFCIVTVLWIYASMVVRDALHLRCLADADSGRRCRDLRLGFLTSILAGLGLCLQAVVPLQGNFVELLLEQNLVSTLTLQTFTHQGGAIVMFLCSVVHEVMMLRLYYKSSTLAKQLGPWAGYSLGIKASAMFFAFATITASIAWHPASGLDHSASATRLTQGALGQWAFVLSMLVFFGTYTPDLRVLAAA
eukprot:EG_transcript_11951